MITLVVSPEEFGADQFVVSGDRYQHLFRARRVELGAQVRVVDGQGGARWSHVKAVRRQEADLETGASAPAREPDRKVRLIAPLPRPERAAWMVEKATEIGVVAIRFVHCERAPRDAGEKTLARLRRVAVAAVEQCHRSRVPEITGVHAWEELSLLLADSSVRWLLDPQAPVASSAAGAAAGEAAGASLLLGPEGGFTDQEHQHACELGCLPVGLGPTILRIETAALVGAARLLLG